MIIIYFLSVILILILNATKVPEYFVMIFTDAFAAIIIGENHFWVELLAD